MSGGFNYGNDGRLYLFLQNQSGYTLTFKGSVYSPLRKDGNSETCTVYPGNGIYLGPTTPWRWQWCEGDRYTITYPNGYTQTWTCPTTDYKGPIFRGENSDGYIPKGTINLRRTISGIYDRFDLYNKGGVNYVKYGGYYYNISGPGTVTINNIKYNKP